MVMLKKYLGNDFLFAPVRKRGLLRRKTAVAAIGLPQPFIHFVCYPKYLTISASDK